LPHLARECFHEQSTAFVYDYAILFRTVGAHWLANRDCCVLHTRPPLLQRATKLPCRRSAVLVPKVVQGGVPGSRLIQSGLVQLVIADQPVEPLMRHLMRHGGFQISTREGAIGRLQTNGDGGDAQVLDAKG
jgi:hypothetical protein